MSISPLSSPMSALQAQKMNAAAPQFGAGKLKRSAAIVATVAALGGMATGCASEGSRTFSDPVKIAVTDSKGQAKTATVDGDNVVFDASTNQVLGNFNKKGEAYIGDRLVAQAMADGKIYGFTDPSDKNKGIHLADVKVQDVNGTKTAVVTNFITDQVEGKFPLGDYTTQEAGALAALTLLMDAPPKGQQKGTNGSHAGGGSHNDLMLWLLWSQMLSNQRTVIVHQGGGTLDTYRQRNKSRIEPSRRSSGTYTGSKPGRVSYKPSSSSNSGGSKSSGGGFKSSGGGGSSCCRSSGGSY